MKLLKNEQLINSEWLWQCDDDEKDVNVFDAPDKTWLLFGIFYLDELQATNLPVIEKAYEICKEVFHEWALKFPWSEGIGPDIHIETIPDQENDDSYILGKLCVEDNLVFEEGLVVSLLQQVSNRLNEQYFIKVSDTSGDFILAECYEDIPEDYNFPIANNRLWINEGKFKLIPKNYLLNEGLTSENALLFLQKSQESLIEINSISNGIKSKILDKFPAYYLSNLVRVPLYIENPDYLNIIRDATQYSSHIFKNVSSLNDATTDSTITPAKDNGTSVDVLALKDHVDVLKYYFEQNDIVVDSTNFPLYTGRLMCASLQNLIESGNITVDYNETTTNLDSPSSSESFKLSNFDVIDLKADIKPNDDIEPTEDLINKLGSFILDESNMDDFTESNEEKKKKSKQGRRNKANTKDIDLDDVNIDEDDFFEFFLKNALNMKDTELSNYRSEHLRDDISSNEELNELDELFSSTNEDNTDEAVKSIIETLQGNGSTNGGPLEVLLRNLSNEEQ